MSEEILKVLKMVESGKLTSDKAAMLIDTLSKPQHPTTLQAAPSSYENKILTIKVLSADGDDINVNLPIPLVKAVIKSFGRIPVDKMGGSSSVHVDSDLIMSAIETQTCGKIVDIKSADGDIVNVSII